MASGRWNMKNMIHKIRSQANAQPSQAYSEEAEEYEKDPLADMTLEERKKYIIRRTPVINSKYLPHWKSAFAKLRMTKMFGDLHMDLRLYGSNAVTSLEGKLEN